MSLKLVILLIILFIYYIINYIIIINMLFVIISGDQSMARITGGVMSPRGELNLG